MMANRIVIIIQAMTFVMILSLIYKYDDQTIGTRDNVIRKKEAMYEPQIKRNDERWNQ